MKKILKMLVSLSFLFALTGCMKMNIGINITDEKNFSMNTTVLYEKDMFEKSGQSTSSLKKQFENEDGVKSVKEISKTIDKKEYIGAEIEFDKETSKKVLDGSVSVGKDGDKKIYTLDMGSSDLNSALGDSGLGLGSLKDSGYSAEQLKNYGLEMTITVKMPGKIKSATIGKVDGDTVVIDIFELSTDSENIKIVSEPSSGNSSIFIFTAIGVGVVAVLAIAAVVILSKRKKDNSDSLEEANTYEAPNSEEVVNDQASEETTEEVVNEEVSEETTEEVVNEDNSEQ